METTEQKSKTKRRVRPWLIAGLALLLVLAVAYPVWLSFARSDDIPVRGSLAEYSWEELSRISQKISESDSNAEAYEITAFYNLTREGRLYYKDAYKDVALSDGRTTRVYLVGVRHDDKSDGSGKAGLTFMFADAIAGAPMNDVDSNEGGWESSAARSFMAQQLYAALPQDLQAAIVAVDKTTDNRGRILERKGDANSVSYVDGVDSAFSVTSDKLWLFSAVEILGEVNQERIEATGGQWNLNEQLYWSAAKREGAQYRYFAQLNPQFNVEAPRLRVRNMDPEIPNFYRNWWLRTPRYGTPTDFMIVTRPGQPIKGHGASNEYGIVPGFCI